MRFASVCSGIEAPSVAWHPLGWKAAFYAEIDRFPSAVLDHHYPAVPNLGDMTRFHEWPDAAFDVLVGGTPCQSFSVAGLRAGLADPRGNLALVFLALADRFRPEWVVWENVPGVLSSAGGRDFGSFLGGLGQLGYGWAYRVLDAQYFGVPQRRRRVFVVGNSGGWQRAAAVLFERSSLQGNPAPSREPGEGVAASVIKGAAIGRKPEAGPQYGEHLADGSCYTLNCTEQHAVVAPTLEASAGRSRGAGTPVSMLAPTLSARTKGGGGLGTDFDCDGGLVPVMTLAIRGRGDSCDLETRDDGVANSILTPGGGRSGIGCGAVAFDAPIDTDGFSQAVVFDTTQITHAANYSNPKPGDPCHPLAAGMHPPAVAFRADASRSGSAVTPSPDAAGRVRLRDAGFNVYEECAPTLDASAPHGISSGMQVRRLTPRECERLQGFPDDYTLITVKGKPAADGPRYKALGNSMAVPVLRWLGERIQAVQDLA